MRRKVRELTTGDMVKLEPEGVGMITRCRKAPDHNAVPFRKSASRLPVPAHTVCWKVMRGERAGHIAQAYVDPDDECELA